MLPSANVKRSFSANSAFRSVDRSVWQLRLMREVMVLAQADRSLYSAYTSIRVSRVDPRYRSANRE